MAECAYTKRLGIAVVRLSNPPVNALSRRACYLLTEAVKRAQQESSEAIILAPEVNLPFSAGADFKEFDSSPQQGGSDAGSLADLVRTVEESPIPVIAAISGVAFGGGLELALGCHHRLAHPAAKFALPEVKLGLVPGCGGTQRLPRLVSFTKALRMIVSGEPISAKEALEAGLVDEVISGAKNAQSVPQDLTLEAALAYAHQRIKDGKLSVRRTRDLPVPESRMSGFNAAELAKQVMKELRVPPAARGGEAQHGCVEAVMASLSLDIGQALDLERKIFTRLMHGAQSKARRYNFLAERRTTRTHPPADKAVPVRAVAVIGGGTTGSGIVVSFLDAGASSVTLVERDEESLSRSVGTIKAIYGGRIKRGHMTMAQAMDAESRFGAVVGLSREQLGSVDLVVEAVFEEMKVKQDVFRELDRLCPPHCILATNTSSLDVDAIASATNRPAQVLGMHFFSPTHIMRLVECVRGAQSSEQAIATITTSAKKMKKVCTVVGNCNGFVGNRMLFPYKNETDFLVGQGASPYEVDRVLYGYGFPMGPFAMSDLAGLDISWKIRKARGQADPSLQNPRERYSQVGDRMCELGRLGQKTGKGWYKYDPKKTGRAAIPDPEVLAFLDAYRKENGFATRTDINDQEILERCLFPLVNEGFKILEEGIAACPSDIDVIWCSGYSWPIWRGGPMFWAVNEVGLDRLLSRIEYYHQQHPDVAHWRPSALLQRLVARGQTGSSSNRQPALDLHSKL